MTTQPQLPRAVAPREPVPQLQRAGMLDQVEKRLRGLLNDEHRRWRTADARGAGIVESLAELVAVGADRIRPVILLTGYLAAGGDPEAPEPVEAAAALELLDTCTLIRSDVRDNAALRRGIPTLHVSRAAEHERNGWAGEARRFGDSTATLAGDLALSLGDRLAARLPAAAWQIWDDMRTERVIGTYAHEAMAAEYLDDPWPGRCISGCDRGCTAGWYALRHPLRLGAALAGRTDLDTAYDAYARSLHAAWRLRGFLDGGPEYDWDAELLREILLEREERGIAERLIRELVDRASRTAASSRLADGWCEELTAFAVRMAAERG
ncbi:polyprenyl synthetase family protein [Streptomyces rectiverticillatus]|uniref:polyprenyl synthetase family protein n=1 Tax=Streptomyces rectiverticillatus TaxID=173860 RepID=UPI001FE708C3|nr:polyprenyl synthetase family protein [Streptomyces rectiverticillatus]